jgi:hypothetical protein
VSTNDPPVDAQRIEAEKSLIRAVDERVLVEQSEKMETALRNAGVQLEFLRIPGRITANFRDPNTETAQ